MRLKSFTGSQLSQVMEQVRKELGEEAFIVSTIEEKGGVRVTAAIDTMPLLSMAYAQGKSMNVIEKTLDVLEKNKVPSFLTEKILDRLQSLPKNVLDQGLETVFSSVFRLSPKPFQGSKPTILIGPPGGGKSVAIGKLAVQAILEGKEVGVINLDTQKSGAIQQLKAYAEALNIPYYVVKDPQDILPLLAFELKGKRVLIDTTGFNLFCEQEVRYLAEIILVVKVAPLLVLPAALDVYEALDMIEAVKKMGVSRFIHTKTDLSFRLTGLLGVLAENSLELMYVGDGPSLGDRLLHATPSVFYDLVFNRLHHEVPYNIHSYEGGI